MVGEQLVEVDSVADNGTATLVAPHDMELGTLVSFCLALWLTR